MLSTISPKKRRVAAEPHRLHLLPTPVLAIITSYFPRVYDLLLFEQLCRDWNQLISNNELLWRKSKFYLKQQNLYPENIKWMSTIQKQQMESIKKQQQEQWPLTLLSSRLHHIKFISELEIIEYNEISRGSINWFKSCFNSTSFAKGCLRSISLIDCNLFDYHIEQIVKQFPLLIKLNLNHNYRLRGSNRKSTDRDLFPPYSFDLQPDSCELGVVEAIATLELLQEVNLDMCRMIPSTDFISYIFSDTLTSLSLRTCRLNDSHILLMSQNYPLLTSLTLRSWDNEFIGSAGTTQSALQSISNMPNLRKLEWSTTAIPTSDFYTFPFPKLLTSLYIDFSNINDAAIELIVQQCPKLTYLNLRTNERIIGSNGVKEGQCKLGIIESLGQMNNLTDLQLEGSKSIPSFDFTLFPSLTTLTRLNLSSTQFCFHGWKAISCLRLRYLNLHCMRSDFAIDRITDFITEYEQMKPELQQFASSSCAKTLEQVDFGHNRRILQPEFSSLPVFSSITPSSHPFLNWLFLSLPALRVIKLSTHWSPFPNILVFLRFLASFPSTATTDMSPQRFDIDLDRSEFEWSNSFTLNVAPNTIFTEPLLFNSSIPHWWLLDNVNECRLDESEDESRTTTKAVEMYLIRFSHLNIHKVKLKWPSWFISLNEAMEQRYDIAYEYIHYYVTTFFTTCFPSSSCTSTSVSSTTAHATVDIHELVSQTYCPHCWRRCGSSLKHEDKVEHGSHTFMSENMQQ